MAIDTKQHRLNRIDTLLYELQYEITRGMMEGDVDETLVYEFAVPISRRIPSGVVHCKFSTRPVQRFVLPSDLNQPKLRVIK
jgi:hypothetical protein